MNTYLYVEKGEKTIFHWGKVDKSSSCSRQSTTDSLIHGTCFAISVYLLNFHIPKGLTALIRHHTINLLTNWKKKKK